MISCPAAKQIRFVNPSIATVSPSRTSSATAFRIDVTLELIRRPPVLWSPKDTELVALRIAHLRPKRAALLYVAAHGGAKRLQPFHFLGHRARGPQVEVYSVLHDLRLGDRLEVHLRLRRGVAENDAVVLQVVRVVIQLVAASSRPERGDAKRVGTVERQRIGHQAHLRPGLDLGNRLLEDLEADLRLILAEHERRRDPYGVI